MDPKVLMELSQLIQQLPPEQLNRMQSLMHNMMAGHDVRREMEEFERALPSGFREKIVAMAAANPGAFAPGMDTAFTNSTPVTSTEPVTASSMDLREARLTLLRGVASGQLSPEDAERLLFNNA